MGGTKCGHCKRASCRERRGMGGRDGGGGLQVGARSEGRGSRAIMGCGRRDVEFEERGASFDQPRISIC